MSETYTQSFALVFGALSVLLALATLVPFFNRKQSGFSVFIDRLMGTTGVAISILCYLVPATFWLAIIAWLMTVVSVFWLGIKREQIKSGGST